MDSPSLSTDATWRNGTGAAQVNHGWHDKRSLAYGANEDLDLSDVAAPLEVAWLEDVQFDAIKGLVVQNLDETYSLTVGPSTADGWDSLLASTITIRPEATFCVMCGDSDTTGYVVTGGSKDNLRITSGGVGSGTHLYKIALVGINT